jgi:multicomponent Na+:H+ antiporter subunit D
MRLLAPILVPLFTAAVLLLTPRRPLPQRWIACIGAMLQLVCGILLFVVVERDGIQVVQAGGWPAPFGITIVADLLASMLVVAAGFVGVAVSIYAFAGVDPRREGVGYHVLLQILMMGVCGAFLTGDLFNLYVWFEVMLVASFVLIALHRTSEQLAAAFKYVTINLVASALFLTALGLLYGSTGTLNMADLASVLPGRDQPVVDLVLAMLFLTSFGIKAALFPLFFWLPASYHTPPAAIGAVFAGLLTKVGVYALLRVFTLLFREAPPFVFTLVLVISAATMIVGLIGALTQRDFRRILSFNLVGHIGYTTLGLGVGTRLALAASILYLLHHILVISNMFLVSGIFLRLRRTSNLGALGSIYRDHPGITVLAMIPLFSLAGVPPLSGFIGKLAIVQGTFAAGSYWIGGTVLFVSLLTLLSMSRLWDEAFWKPAAPGADKASPVAPMVAPIAMLSLLTLGVTFGAQPLFELAMRAASQLLDPSDYIRAVLGGGR